MDNFLPFVGPAFINLAYLLIPHLPTVPNLYHASDSLHSIPSATHISALKFRVGCFFFDFMCTPNWLKRGADVMKISRTLAEFGYLP
jgi:hypothetical protein